MGSEFNCSSPLVTRWPRQSSASRRRRCRFRWWSGHSRLLCRFRRSSARRRSWRPKSRSRQRQRNTDWRSWLRQCGEYYTVVSHHLQSQKSRSFSLLSCSLQLIMEAEAEAESIRVSADTSLFLSFSVSHFIPLSEKGLTHFLPFQANLSYCCYTYSLWLIKCYFNFLFLPSSYQTSASSGLVTYCKSNYKSCVCVDEGRG